MTPGLANPCFKEKYPNFSFWRLSSVAQNSQQLRKQGLAFCFSFEVEAKLNGRDIITTNNFILGAVVNDEISDSNFIALSSVLFAFLSAECCLIVLHCFSFSTWAWVFFSLKMMPIDALFKRQFVAVTAWRCVRLQDFLYYLPRHFFQSFCAFIFSKGALGPNFFYGSTKKRLAKGFVDLGAAAPGTKLSYESIYN